MLLSILPCTGQPPPPTTKKHPVPNISCAKAKKLWLTPIPPIVVEKAEAWQTVIGSRLQGGRTEELRGEGAPVFSLSMTCP